MLTEGRGGRLHFHHRLEYGRRIRIGAFGRSDDALYAPSGKGFSTLHIRKVFVFIGSVLDERSLEVSDLSLRDLLFVAALCNEEHDGRAFDSLAKDAVIMVAAFVRGEHFLFERLGRLADIPRCVSATGSKSEYVTSLFLAHALGFRLGPKGLAIFFRDPLEFALGVAGNLEGAKYFERDH